MKGFSIINFWEAIKIIKIAASSNGKITTIKNLRRHKGPFINKVLIAFEDLDRTTPVCDHDFNDLMIYATVTP